MADKRDVELVERLLRGDLSRRQLMKGAIGAGIATSVTSPAFAGTTQAAPRPGAVQRRSRAQTDVKTLVIADALSGGLWLNLDPGWFYEINPAAAMNVIYEPLYHLPDSTKPTEFEPLLATGMPEVSEDGLEVTIKLRPGVKFHRTGNEMTAEDWVFSWNRLKNIKFQGSFLGTDYWDKVEAVDPLALKITLKSPNAALVPILSSIPLSVTDSRTVREHGGTDAEDADQVDTAKDWINENSVGTGPYLVTQWDINSEVIIERNPDYWGEQPFFDRIIWRNVANAPDQLRAVQTGEADIAYFLDPDAVGEVEADPNLQLISGPTLAIEYLALNLREEIGGPLAIKEVRQAIGYAIDYDGIINGLMRGAAVKPATVVPLPLLGSEEVQDLGYRLDLAKAQELFDASGVGEIELSLTYASGGAGEGGLDLATACQKLQADLQQVRGLKIKLTPMDPTARLEEFRAGKLQFTISGWTPDYPDVHTFAEPFGKTDTAAARRVGYSNPQVDEWLAQGIAELDPEKRKEIYINIQKQLIEDAPFLPLYQPVDRKAAAINVQGVMTHSVYQLQLRYASKTE